MHGTAASAPLPTPESHLVSQKQFVDFGTLVRVGNEDLEDVECLPRQKPKLNCKAAEGTVRARDHAGRQAQREPMLSSANKTRLLSKYARVATDKRG